jgi:hypothetical protein
VTEALRGCPKSKGAFQRRASKGVFQSPTRQQGSISKTRKQGSLSKPDAPAREYFKDAPAREYFKDAQAREYFKARRASKGVFQSPPRKQGSLSKPAAPARASSHPKRKQPLLARRALKSRPCEIPLLAHRALYPPFRTASQNIARTSTPSCRERDRFYLGCHGESPGLRRDRPALSSPALVGVTWLWPKRPH